MPIASDREIQSTEAALIEGTQGFCREQHALYETFDGKDVRQLFAIGASSVPGSQALRVADGALVVFETRRRRVHAYRYEGATLEIGRAALSELVWMTEASCYEDGGDTARLRFEYIEGRGWSVQQALALLGRGIDPSCAPQAGAGRFDMWAECRVIGEGWAPTARIVLHSLFSSRHPELEHCGLAWTTPHLEPLLPQVAACREAFLEGLQRPALEACAVVHQSSVRAYNAFAHEEARIAQYRSQAASAIPVIGLLYATRWEDDVLGLRVAVDRRLPLIDRAASLYGVPKETVRFFACRPLSALGMREYEDDMDLWLRQPDVLLQALAAMPPARRPQKPSDWHFVYDLVRRFEPWDGAFAEIVHGVFRDTARMGFDHARQRLDARYGGMGALDSCKEFLDCLEASINGECDRLGYTPTSRAWMARLVKRRGFWRLLELSTRWRAAVSREASLRLGEIEAARGERPFPWLMAPVMSYEGLQVVFLDRYSALVEEGLRMSHCVASLYAACASGERYAFSVRSSEGASLATFDVSITPAESWPQLTLNEVRGCGNEAPAPDVELAIKRVVGRMRIWMHDNREQAEQWLARRRGRASRRLEARWNALLGTVQRTAVIAALGGEAAFRKLAASVSLDEARKHAARQQKLLAERAFAAAKLGTTKARRDAHLAAKAARRAARATKALLKRLSANSELRATTKGEAWR